MAMELDNFLDDELDADYVTWLLDQQSPDAAMHYGRMWEYFRNETRQATGPAANSLNANSRPYFQAQEIGLPARITGVERCGGQTSADLRRKEVVIENDIAWRVHTMVDFLFGKPPTIRSLAPDENTAKAVEGVMSALFNANGGTGFFQELALLGCVYGFVDVALRLPAEMSAPRSDSNQGQADQSEDGLHLLPNSDRPGISESSGGQSVARDANRRQSDAVDRAMSAAGQAFLEVIEAPRILPILQDDDYRTVRYWIQRFNKQPSRMAQSKRSFLRLPWSPRPASQPASVEVVEIIGSQWWQRYEDRQLVAEGPNPLGCLPIVHIQNVAMPGTYEGAGDVEPLMPLQDELNTRLSDRAHRVTYQSFKMYLGKGIDDFLERPVGPGQMWATQNLAASIEEFGSDSGSPSEDAHIDQVRAALDKVSGVTPLAAGLIRGNVGYLTSATALKVLMSGLLSRTEKKRLTYGAGINRVVELVLHWLDTAGLLRTAPADRRIEIHWPDPLPADEGQLLQNAQIKAQLGVPVERVLAELGYDRKKTST
ncbi:MAG: phage portal protein [Planctomycetes bacterium]|nr:phage portal protein [Planctomycetota bacterium]